jgi:hypothetical protein
VQGFWMRVNAGGGTLTLENTNRLHGSNLNRLKAPAAISTNQIVRLQVSNGINNNETVVYFNEHATAGFDNYDSPLMSNNSISIPEIYTMAGSEEVVINGLQKIEIGNEIALGFMTLSSNEFSIRTNEFSNIPPDIKLILSDKLVNQEYDLTTGDAYNFSSDATNSLDRFSIIFRSNSAVTGKFIELPGNNTHVFKNLNNQIVIVCNEELISGANVSVFNSIGQKIVNQQISNGTTILNQALESGIYVVKVNFKENSITRKLVL